MWYQRRMLIGPKSVEEGMSEISKLSLPKFGGTVGGVGDGLRVRHQLTVNNSMRVNMIALTVNYNE